MPVRPRAAYKFKVNCRAVSYAVQTSRSNSKVTQVIIYDALSMFNPDNEQKVTQKGKFIRGMKAQTLGCVMLVKLKREEILSGSAPPAHHSDTTVFSTLNND